MDCFALENVTQESLKKDLSKILKFNTSQLLTLGRRGRLAVQFRFSGAIVAVRVKHLVTWWCVKELFSCWCLVLLPFDFRNRFDIICYDMVLNVFYMFCSWFIWTFLYLQHIQGPCLNEVAASEAPDRDLCSTSCAWTVARVETMRGERARGCSFGFHSGCDADSDETSGRASGFPTQVTCPCQVQVILLLDTY